MSWMPASWLTSSSKMSPRRSLAKGEVGALRRNASEMQHATITGLESGLTSGT